MQDIGLRYPIVGDLDADPLSALDVFDSEKRKGLLLVRYIGGRCQFLLGQGSGAPDGALDGQGVSG